MGQSTIGISRTHSARQKFLVYSSRLPVASGFSSFRRKIYTFYGPDIDWFVRRFSPTNRLRKLRSILEDELIQRYSEDKQKSHKPGTDRRLETLQKSYC